jgi:hypothetical protein
MGTTTHPDGAAALATIGKNSTAHGIIPIGKIRLARKAALLLLGDSSIRVPGANLTLTTIPQDGAAALALTGKTRQDGMAALAHRLTRVGRIRPDGAVARRIGRIRLTQAAVVLIGKIRRAQAVAQAGDNRIRGLGASQIPATTRPARGVALATTGKTRQEGAAAPALRLDSPDL